MKNIIQLIREQKFTEAEDQIDNTVPLIMEKKLLEMKKAVAAKMSEQMITASKKLRRGLTENGKESSEDEEDSEEKLDEKRGLWYNIHKKRKRIESGSGERMRKPGSEGAPSEKDLRNSQTEEALEENINEEELDEARISIVKARIRGGKIQRRKRVSNVPGMTLRGGTLKRMSAAERRRRKMGARKGKAKRRAKLSRSLMKRKRSLQRRKSLGL